MTSRTRRLLLGLAAALTLCLPVGANVFAAQSNAQASHRNAFDEAVDLGRVSLQALSPESKGSATALQICLLAVIATAIANAANRRGRRVAASIGVLDALHVPQGWLGRGPPHLGLTS